jgi:sugar lactone lactonase YvrE
MTQIKVDTIADAAGTGAADFADGITIAGGALSALNTAEYYSSASEPTSPKNGAIWWDTTNEKVMVYIADEFKKVELNASAGGGWTVDISNASYDSVSFSVASQDGIPYGIAFSSDGTKMYIPGFLSSSIYQYSLSTGFDLSTASYNSVSFSVSSQEIYPTGVTFNTDGTKMYMIGNNNDTIHQYSLSTGFDLSTASYDSVSLSVSSQDTNPSSVTFNSDGTKMYIIGVIGGNVLQYSLSTGFDLSTASYDSVSFSVSSQETNPFALAFNTDGTKMYVTGSGSDTVHQYSLSTGFDLSTASYDSVSFSVASQDGNPRGLAFNTDGTKMYVTGIINDAIYQYSTGL